MVLAALLVVRARYSADLSAFLPNAPNARERLLVEQLRNGAASRLLLVAIGGGTPEARAAISITLAHELRTEQWFTAVENGSAETEQRDEAFLYAHRYLLSPDITAQRFTTAGLHAAIEHTLGLLAIPGGILAAPSLTHDPTGELFAVLKAFGPQHAPRRVDGVWVTRSAREAVLLVRTRAPGSDTDAQAHDLAAIRSAFQLAKARVPARMTLQVAGTGVFAVAARSRITRQVIRLSLLGGALVFGLLALAYRSLTALALALIPVASGALAGVAAVALRFGVVQGVTLGFGVTLIGEAVDYSIYLFVQSRTAGAASPAAWKHKTWPTVRLGMLTSMCGFAALLPSAFPGLAQLGWYAFIGVLTAGMVTRFVLPQLLPARFMVRDLRPLGARAERFLARLRPVRIGLVLVAVGAVIVLYSHGESLWNRQLAALSPVPHAAQQLDARLRAALGAPGEGELVVLSASTRQAALEEAEQAAVPLRTLVEQGVLAGFQSPAQFLPSRALQRRRQQALPDPAVLRRRLAHALRGLPLDPRQLTPFLAAVERARHAAPLGPAALTGTSFATVLDGLLIREGTHWDALLPLQAPTGGHIKLTRVRAALASFTSSRVTVLDLKHEANHLYAVYLRDAVRLALVGLAAIVLLLLAVLRSMVRTLRVVLPLALAVLTVASILVLLGVHLTLLHVIGMLLIVAIGSNYALFFECGSEQPTLTLASLLLANAATVIGFGVLACSNVPVLRDLGQTVSPGAALALLYSALLAPVAQGVRGPGYT